MSPEENFGLSNENSITSHNADSDINAKKKPAEQKFPGCFKKTLAFTIDELIIAIICIIALFPFSNAIGSLYQHAWLPGYIVGAFYFVILESSILRSQSIGKMIFSIKVSSTENEPISPLVSLGRYFLITIPFYNILISNSIASTVGITNTAIGGTIYLIVVGLLFSGNSFFMLFHPQKRGLHDILLKSVVVPSSQVELPALKSFTLKPLLSGIIGIVVLSALFGNLLYQVDKNPDFADLKELSDKIKMESSIANIGAFYRTFSMSGKPTMFAIEVDVPIPYDKFDDKQFIDEISNKLYPLVKKINTNPKVDTITIIFHTQKFIGAFPINKANKFPRKLSEIN